LLQFAAPKNVFRLSYLELQEKLADRLVALLVGWLARSWVAWNEEMVDLRKFGTQICCASAARKSCVPSRVGGDFSSP